MIVIETRANSLHRCSESCHDLPNIYNYSVLEKGKQSFRVELKFLWVIDTDNRT